MNEADPSHVLGPALAGALEQRGYTSLTPVQQAVLDPDANDRDLRITSQTGSGKTVAVGFALRALVEAAPKERAPGPAKPRAIVVAPTRELAKQVETELGWLFAPLRARVVSVTGGASYRDEMRALSAHPAIVAGTPGRLLDHLDRGSIDASELGAIVLDEADRMLDMGFREELEAILAKTPPERRTHLVSATFPRDVRALADRVQNDPFEVQGTPLGAANADIDHVLYLVDPRDRIAAIVNLLLASGGDQTLIFARTRADVAELAQELGRRAFVVMMLSGEMEQRDRDRALRAFKTGQIRALVATDVAARGIDVQDIARVIHAEPPTDADTYTHRAGRTGRAGKKGTSAVLVAPSARVRVVELLRRAGVRARFEKVPSASSIREARDAAFLADLLADDVEDRAYDPRLWALAEKLSEGDQVTRTIARLLERARLGGPTEPCDVRPIELPIERAPRTFPPPARGERSDRGGQYDRSERPRRGKPGDSQEGFIPFKVTWGAAHGADARRLLALVCRRGGVRGGDIGAIHVGQSFSVVEVKSDLAAGFEAAAGAPDPRDPRVRITRDQGSPPAERPHVDRPYTDRPRTDRPHADRPHADRPHADRPRADRPHADRPHADRPRADRPRADRPAPARDARPSRGKPSRAERRAADRPPKRPR